MLRAFLVLLLGVLLLAGSETAVFGSSVVAATASGIEATQDKGDDAADDCCPPRPAGHDQDGDCCDVDFGQCCAASASALPSTSAGTAHPRPPALELRPSFPSQPLFDRATGPPPTPPPIG